MRIYVNLPSYERANIWLGLGYCTGQAAKRVPRDHTIMPPSSADFFCRSWRRRAGVWVVCPRFQHSHGAVPQDVSYHKLYHFEDSLRTSVPLVHILHTQILVKHFCTYTVLCLCCTSAFLLHHPISRQTENRNKLSSATAQHNKANTHTLNNSTHHTTTQTQTTWQPPTPPPSPLAPPAPAAAPTPPAPTPRRTTCAKSAQTKPPPRQRPQQTATLRTQSSPARQSSGSPPGSAKWRSARRPRRLERRLARSQIWSGWNERRLGRRRG